MYEADRRYHLHCDLCGYVSFHAEPVQVPKTCPKCSVVDGLLSCTDMDTGESWCYGTPAPMTAR